ncbi:YafY family protein [Oscillatoria sp. CS-180]|uniref:helix-turn-helix transcriptional regulator n=1 Tax=Oscillatoria sp. CS-180 TaxID=3021720 RepID=UPI00232DF148|nr:YafY family protein [Oscillatoria sp. CS-180]MDB9524383.1 YafY family protein [Oscillatoria sp. CS-180]
MSRKLERLLAIDELIRKPVRQTALSLAKALEVSERTIRGDLDFLRDRFSAPIAYSRRNGYYFTDPNWRLPSIPLSQGELFALTLGARMLSAYSGSAYREQLESAIEQLAKRLPEQTWVDLQQLTDDSVMFRLGAELDLNPEVWQILEQACQHQQRVWIRYATPGKPISERQLDPYVLHFSRNNPYVTGWCHTRKEPRWFRVDRIQTIELIDETFKVDPTFDREAHFASAFQHEVGGVPQEMLIWFDVPTAPYIRERRWHPTQQIEEHPDGSLTLRFVVRGLNEVKRWVLFYGRGARVLGPPQLVAMVRDEVEGMQSHYQQGEGQ